MRRQLCQIKKWWLTHVELFKARTWYPGILSIQDRMAGSSWVYTWYPGDTKYSRTRWLACVGTILGMYLVSRDTKHSGQGGWLILGVYLVPRDTKYSKTRRLAHEGPSWVCTWYPGILSIQDRGG